jgi:dipeptidyl aminopeptidase/acylaminoacyl peptidase
MARLLSFFTLCFFALSGARAQSSGPDERQLTDPKTSTSQPKADARPLPIDDLFFTRSVSSGAWSPNGKEILFTTDISGRSNLWKVSADGGWPLQLTQSDDRQYGGAWSPDGKWIVFQQDIGGNELWDIYAVPSDGGQVVNLTNTPETREESPRWSPDGKTIAMDTKPKASTVYNISLLDWSTKKVTQLTHEDTPNHIWRSVAWSPDGKTLYANRLETSFTDADTYAIDVATAKATNLTAHQGRSLNTAASLSADGKTLLLGSDRKAGYQNVALFDLATRQLTWLTDTKWDASPGDFSPDGKRFTYTINADGRSGIYVGDVATKHSDKIPVADGLNYPSGNPSAFAPAGGSMLVSHQSSSEPGDYWIYDFASRKSRQLTFSAIASLTSAPKAPGQIVHYKSFDGKIISALLWMPFNLKPDGSNPALVLPHGGPTGQHVDYWSPEIAAFVSRGYVCIAPNVRGSTGYGMDFQKANYKDLGGGDLQDEVFAAKFLEVTGYVNPRKIGITGGSYGGYMTLMAIGKTPDVWAAGVESYGIINWMTMLQHEDPMLQEYEKSLLGDPEKDRAVYDAASPITYIHKVKAPLLVLQGENDPRVPKEEAEQVVELLKNDGKTVEARYYPNEGHGFEKRENQIDAIRRTLDWLDKYLKEAH